MGFTRSFLRVLRILATVDITNSEENIMNNEFETRRRAPAIVTALLLTLAIGTANADELIMGTITSDVPGTDEILDGDYLAGISKSKKYVDAGSNVRRVAARNNLCVAYTATRQYDDAVKWCDAAIEVGRRGGIVKNNRAVLAYQMGEYEASKAWLDEARDARSGSLFPAKLDHNEHVIEQKVAETEGEKDIEAFAKVN